MAAAPASANRGADSDDWEYEYDDTDTQDVYFTLDLTSHTAVAAPRKGFGKLEHDIFQETRKKKNGLNKRQAGDGTPQDQGDDDIEIEDDDDEERLQIVGLHHDNPIVSYKGQAYTCKWASTIGTDLFFARAPDADADDDQPPAPDPLRPLGTFNMLGASSTRLVATAAKLRERTSTEQRGTPAPAGPSNSSAVASNSQPPAANPSSLLFTRAADVPHFYVPPNATRAQKRQASFLENFAAVKARLGEQDTVRSNSYTGRSGARTAAAEAPYDAQSEDEAGDLAGPSTPRSHRGNARQSASFLSAQRAAHATPSANGDGSPAASASPSAEPAPTRGRGRGRKGRPRGRGRGRGRPRGRGRGARTANKAIEPDPDGGGDGDGDGDAADAGGSVATPALWDDAMTGVESASPRRFSVGEVLAQQQRQQQQGSQGHEAGPDAMQE
ncbi:uncharacterized protein J3D65DRAFT_633472 [Phyllosticta citribraziliensis]|uniref:Transcription factor TFIIIC triple barrel domain-containing protein n=1 Tax=Phyllosticta citribraziliensis TaxID=989973 RepID=A0ABR1LGI0_9PEZI